MKSLQSQAVLFSIRISKLLSDVISKDNLQKKREQVKKLERFAKVNKDVKIKSLKTPKFKAEWITVPNSREDKILLYFHGGGFLFNFIVYHRDFISRVARESQLKALSLDYSLAPENPFPTAVNEGLAAYKWLLKNGYRAKNIVIMGDSAGGSLALSLLQVLKKNKLPMPACAVVIAPATDATLVSYKKYSDPNDYIVKLESLDFFINSYFAKTPHNDPIASPLFGDYKNMPPLLIHVDKKEVLYGDSLALYKKAKKEGQDVELYQADGLWHVWHIFARFVPEAREAIKNIGQFITKNLG